MKAATSAIICQLLILRHEYSMLKNTFTHLPTHTHAYMYAGTPHTSLKQYKEQKY